MNMKSIALGFTSLLLSLQIQTAHAANPKVEMKTNMGTITFELYPEKAPVSVKNFLQYVNSGHYENTIFHRVIKNFMNQGGGFDTNYKKKEPREPILNEADNGLTNDKYTVAMARTSAPHSATNQFFINTKNNAFLNHTSKTSRGWGYAVFGKVVDGKDTVNTISKAKTAAHAPFASDVPIKQVVILKMTEIK